MMKVSLTVSENPNEKEVDLIRKELRSFNEAAVGKYQRREVVIYAKENDQLIGGMYGWLSWGWAHLDIAWVSEKHRGQGIGNKLLHAFERFAVDHQVFNARANTGSFQAPQFYLKNGYEIFAQLDIIAPDGSAQVDYFLKKRLE